MYRAAGLIGAGLLVLGTGCNLMPFVSNDERIQMSYVRSFKKGLSPTDNKSFGILLREVGKLAGYNLPTKYGVNLATYLSPFPSFEALPPTVQSRPVSNSTGELTQISDPGGQLLVSYVTTPGSGGAQQAYTYTAKIERTPTGTMGKYAVQTTGSNWTAPAGGAGTNTLGLGRAPQVLTSTAFQGELTLPQSAGQASLRVDLGFDQGSGGSTPVPRTASVNFVMQSGLTANVSGSFGSLQNTRLNGTVTVKGDKTPETYQADIQAASGNLEIALINDQRKLRIDLKYEDGLLSGVAKATDGRQAELAKIVQEAGKSPEIQFADGTKETWNFTLPAS